MGHLARVFEEAGIATVSVFVKAFRHVAEEMKVPRTIVTRHPMGRTLGAPGESVGQRRVVLAALQLLDNARLGATVSELSDPYRPGAGRQSDR